MKCDVLVVGGGPAGAFASSLLSKAGVNVLVIDRSSFPREKICGGLITQKANALMLEDMPELKIFSNKIEKIVVFHAEDLLLSLSSPSPLKIVRRYQFDNALMNLSIRNGTKAILGQSIVEFNPNSKTIILENNMEIHYGFLIGADGVFSAVRRNMGLPNNTTGFCVESQLPYPAEDDFAIDRKKIEIHYGFCECGYAWLFPRQDALVVGMGNVGIHKNKKHIIASFNAFCKTHGIPQNTFFRGAHLPSGDSTLLGSEKANNVLLIGDAAGLIDPITGEGIYYALFSAKKAVEAILSERNALTNYSYSMQIELNRIRSAIQVRDAILNPIALKHNLSSLQNVPHYVEELVDETILRYSRTYMSASDELHQMFR